MRTIERKNSDGSKTIYTLNLDGKRDGITTTLDEKGIPYYVVHYSNGVFMSANRVICAGKVCRHYSFSGNITLEGEIIVYD